MDENLKTLLKDLWKDKPLLITVLVGLVVVGYILYKNSQAGGEGASTTAPALAGGGATYVEGGSGSQSAAPINVPVSVVSVPVAMPTSPAGATPTAMSHAPGTTFSGPTGVKHYVTTGTQTLAQIAQKFGLQSWNNIYAIPDNQKIFGKKSATQAKGYRPAAGQTITLPGSTLIGF